MPDAHLQDAGLQGQQLRDWQDPTDMQTLQQTQPNRSNAVAIGLWTKHGTSHGFRHLRW